jgi:ADP-dependent NAD(P)H-hydrate dehydratase / NAD(P)H-hydrate epimerase
MRWLGRWASQKYTAAMTRAPVLNFTDNPKLYSATSARALDLAAVAALGVESFALMQRAGQSAATVALSRWPAAQHILVLCGPGNNGGDGYVLAKHLLQAVRQVCVYASAAPKTEDAKRAQAQYLAAGGLQRDLADLDQPALQRADLICDALFGIGAKALGPALAAQIATINAAKKPILAIDLPTGLDADTGHAEIALRAELTLCMLVRKAGLYTGQARNYCGQIALDTLQIPPALAEAEAPVAQLQFQLRYLPALRPRASHKGDFGHLMLIGGARGMGGAIRLSADAALRVGAGLVSVYCASEHIAGLIAGRPELMARAWPADMQAFSPPAKCNALALGPGLGVDAQAQALLRRALQFADAGDIPIVLDADALNILASDALQPPKHSVLTPHPGEAARLLRVSIGQIERDRYRAASALAQLYGAVVVLKGAGTIIAGPDGNIVVSPLGNPGMASGGMGDVLTGAIAGLIAQGLSPWQAACDGVYAHAFAGDWAARNGERGMLASEVIGALRRAVNP